MRKPSDGGWLTKIGLGLVFFGGFATLSGVAIWLGGDPRSQSVVGSHGAIVRNIVWEQGRGRQKWLTRATVDAELDDGRNVTVTQPLSREIAVGEKVTFEERLRYGGRRFFFLIEPSGSSR